MPVLNQTGSLTLQLGLLNMWKGIYSEITMQASLCEKQCMDINTNQCATVSQIRLYSFILLTSQSGIQRPIPILVCHDPFLFVDFWETAVPLWLNT